MRWVSWAPSLRWADALVAWLFIWGLVALSLERGSGETHAVLAALIVTPLAFVPPLRARWRPVSGAVGLAVSRRLRAGDSAWYIGRRQPERVLVTARRRLRIVIATGERSATEGLSVRRTRVILIPTDDPRPRRT
jgi:hypothetical protein